MKLITKMLELSFRIEMWTSSKEETDSCLDSARGLLKHTRLIFPLWPTVSITLNINREKLHWIIYQVCFLEW